MNTFLKEGISVACRKLFGLHLKAFNTGRGNTLRYKHTLGEDADIHPPRALSQTQAVSASVNNDQAMGLLPQRIWMAACPNARGLRGPVHHCSQF